MSLVHNRSSWPYCDSESPEAITGEKDACGVGFIAHIDGKPSHWILRQALKGLYCMEHRGGCGGDGDSGDGSGILCAIPWQYLKEVWPGNANDRLCNLYLSDGKKCKDDGCCGAGTT